MTRQDRRGASNRPNGYQAGALQPPLRQFFIRHRRKRASRHRSPLVLHEVGNGLRIVSFVVLGNHGFAEVVARFHLNAGWIFFSVLFLVYLFSIYRNLLVPAKR